MKGFTLWVVSTERRQGAGHDSETALTIGSRTVTKLEAARELARVNGGTVTVTFADSDGDKHDISIYARVRAFGDITPAQVHWYAPLAVPAADARAFAAAVALGAEIAEMADGIAAEQEHGAALK